MNVSCSHQLIHAEAAAARLLKSEPRDEKVPVVKLEAGLGRCIDSRIPLADLIYTDAQ